MLKKYFGTDGIRGLANSGNISIELMMKLGAAAGSLFAKGDHRHSVVIAKDTRLSGYMIEPALTAGFVSVGMDVILLGPMPTPAVAMLTKSLRADLGIMISASHNPYYDNGIKIFDPYGFKLSDQIELLIEKRIDSNVNEYSAKPGNLGKTTRLSDTAGRYIEYVKATFLKNRTLTGLKIVIDCANGASYRLGETILWELGADVIAIGVKPDGFNINSNCGSNHPEYIKQEVLKNNADIGIALDGDGDRVIIIDEKGNIIDGDKILALIACYNKESNKLKNSSVISTVMSNLGLEKYLISRDISLIRTEVGDKHVMQKMLQTGINLGGEQSGHIILGDYSTTGDGLIAAIQVLSVMVNSNKLASQLFNLYDPYPQILKNIIYQEKSPLENDKVIEYINKQSSMLKDKYRLLVRKSGTEKLIRIMVEGEDESKINMIAEDIAYNIEKMAS